MISRRHACDPLRLQNRAIRLGWLDVKLPDRKSGKFFDIAQVAAFLVAAQ
jgi:hypothetical protein